MFVFGLPFVSQNDIENVRFNIAAALLGISSIFPDFNSLSTPEEHETDMGLAPQALVGGLSGTTKVLELARSLV